MFKKIFLVLLLSFVYINPTYAASSESAVDNPAKALISSTVSGKCIALRPGTADDLAHILHLYCEDIRIKQYYMQGTLSDPARITSIVQSSWLPKWELGNPFAPRIVVAARDFEISEDCKIVENRGRRVTAGEKLGLFGFTPDDRANTAMFFYLFNTKYWGDHIASETLRTAFEHYVLPVAARFPLVREVKDEEGTVTGTREEPIEYLTATVHPENISSVKMLFSFMGLSQETIEQYGGPRYVHTKAIAEIRDACGLLK
jgi:RimJ/RimL family protein N-acetyltransferase